MYGARSTVGTGGLNGTGERTLGAGQLGTEPALDGRLTWPRGHALNAMPRGWGGPVGNVRLVTVRSSACTPSNPDTPAIAPVGGLPGSNTLLSRIGCASPTFGCPW